MRVSEVYVRRGAGYRGMSDLYVRRLIVGCMPGVYARGVRPWCPPVPWAVLGVCVKHLLKGADSFKACCARTGLADCHCRTAIAVPVEFAKQLTAIMAVINL